MTNTELLTDIMEHSRYGAMSQLFVIDALSKHCQAIIDNKEAIIADHKEKEANGQFQFINMEVWCAVAEEILSKIDNR